MKKKLEKMTVEELLECDEFQKPMAELIDYEKSSVAQARRTAFTQGKRLQRTVIDRLEERGVMNATDMIHMYAQIICGVLMGYSSIERSYIKMVGLQAYKVTIQKLKNTDG